jgi:isoquinoline 1-oxidoreductase
MSDQAQLPLVNAPLAHDKSCEAEQHNVQPLSHLFEIKRRDLFRLLGAGLVVGIARPSLLAQESGRGRVEALPSDLASWLHVGSDGKITVFTGKVEMGQNIRTSLAQQVAEELRTPVQSLTLVMGDTDLVPFDLGTFGSRSTPQMGTQLRKAATCARELLLDMAAQRWQADRNTLVAHDGAITNPNTKETLRYSELTHGQKLVKVLAADPEFTPATQWHVAGTSVPKVDGRAFVTGAHQYTSDLTRPGMYYGAVVRPSALNAKLVSLDSKEAEKISGITVVRDGDFVGVVGPDYANVSDAADEIKAEWNAPPQVSETALFDALREPADGVPGGFAANHANGSIAKGMASAAKTLSQTYTVAYVQHAPLEPHAAVAEMGWRQAHGLDRHAAALRRSRGTRLGIPPALDPDPRHRPRHRFRLRRQAHG